MQHIAGAMACFDGDSTVIQDRVTSLLEIEPQQQLRWAV